MISIELFSSVTSKLANENNRLLYRDIDIKWTEKNKNIFCRIHSCSTIVRKCQMQTIAILICKQAAAAAAAAADVSTFHTYDFECCHKFKHTLDWDCVTTYILNSNIQFWSNSIYILIYFQKTKITRKN